ncbi:BZIP transcription factor family protein isoform 1 [Dorcoceras hygrometricum]|uniref:BZIP transcription factor family protein isoform 1 n=1 Tax=Dorcoceras hygrometricum TaxID=472368 RepID=A0A2Z7CQQ9_9LAMI|nr:BZIP transcription factor family protein isoform 1 [Dorcoceras hygrometricum]
MASTRRVLGEPAALSGISHHLPYSNPHMLHNHPPDTSFGRNQEESSFDFGELEEPIVLGGVKINKNKTKETLYSSVKASAILEMLPSWPIPRQRESSKSGEESTDSGSALIKPDSESPISTKAPSDHHKTARAAAEDDSDREHDDLQPPQPPLQSPDIQMESARTGVSQSKSAAKQTTEKTLRRLAQNREAARKSRLRKKAYVQQLESSRMRLSQLEQDIQSARSQGLFIGGRATTGNISSAGAVFDMEYSRWLDEDIGHMSELRAAVQSHLSDGDLRAIVDGYVSHYDEIFRLKGVAAKSDVFHLITGTWVTPVERCYLWMGGFRPSELIKMLIPQLDPLTEQQLLGICGLQQSSQQAEDALAQGLDQLHQSLLQTIANSSLNDSMHHMVIALGKLANLEGFVRQADNLRQQTLHQLRRILTVRQAARCFLVMGEYYGRLRALSSLWASRPRE